MRSSSAGFSSNRNSQNSDIKFINSSSSSYTRGDENGVGNNRSSSTSENQRDTCSIVSNIDRLNKIKRDSCYEDVRVPDRGHLQGPQGSPDVAKDAYVCSTSSSSGRNSLLKSGSGVGISGATLEVFEKVGEKEQRRDQQLSTSLLDRDSRRGTPTENQPIVDTHEEQVFPVILLNSIRFL